MTDTFRVLVIEDNPLDRALLEAILEPHGYEIEFATNGVEGLARLEANPSEWDVVLLDLHLPQMGGLELLRIAKSKSRLKAIPVILQTASNARSDLIDGIRAGALYYLTKPYDREMLLTVVGTAARDRANHRHLQDAAQSAATALKVLQSARFTIRTVDEARDLGSLLAGLCGDPQNAVLGITELLLNAVEHGNLGITYDEKTALNATGKWREEVERRLVLPENVSKRVEVDFNRNGDALQLTISDQGNGFDWSRYLEADPTRVFDTHGRGILIAKRITFDTLEYVGAGNRVVGVIRCPKST